MTERGVSVAQACRDLNVAESVFSALAERGGRGAGVCLSR